MTTDEAKLRTYRLLIALSADGSASVGLGRAPRVAVTEADADGIHSWEETPVGWNAIHDSQAHGTHHGTIVGFLQAHRIEAVLAAHAGEPMQVVLGKLGVAFFECDGMSPQTAATRAAGILDQAETKSSTKMS